MKLIKHEPKPLMAARIQSEVRVVLAKRAERQGRFLDTAAAKGREMEPIGRMAG